jgi:serine/threonine-protein kinase
LRGLGLFLALVGVGIVSAFAVVALLLRQEEVRVPDLIGQDIVAVIEIVGQQGLQLKVERRDPSPTLPRDAVISQSPAPGSGIKKGRQIQVVLSQGPSELLTPKLTGHPYRKAEIMIRQAGFLPALISRTSSDKVDRDMVIAQAPVPDTPLEKGGRISLLVSAGRKSTVMVMPDLIGKNPEEAVRILDRMGLHHRLAYGAANKPVKERSVLNQKPLTGSPVAADSSVEIVVSR